DRGAAARAVHHGQDRLEGASGVWGNVALVVGVRWSFRGKDVGSPDSGARIGRLFRRKGTEEVSGNGRRHRIRKLRLLLLLLILLLLGFASFSFGMVTAIAGQIPTCDPARVHHEVDGHIYANDDHTILATLRGSESRILVRTDQIHPWMLQAIVAVEDKRFYQHRGVDVRGSAAAACGGVASRPGVQAVWEVARHVL